MGKALLVLCLLSWPLLPLHAQVVDLELANTIVKKLDQGKESGQSFELMLTINPGQDKAVQRFHLKDDGKTNTVLTFLDKQHRGQRILSTADQIWFFSSRTRRAIKVPASQRLYGDASIGDISRLRYAQDYRASQISADADSYRLELTSIQAAATYQKILLWVDKTSWHPQQAHLFVASGKHLKTAVFTQVSEDNGVIFVQGLSLFAPDKPDKVTTVLSADFKLISTTDAEFTRSYLEMNRS